MAKFIKSFSYEKLLDPEDRNDPNTSLDEREPDSRTSTFKTPFFISSTVLTLLIVLLTVALHFRFQPTPPTYPITLAPTTNKFTANRSLHPFDLATQESWKSLIPAGWSGVRAQSPSSGSLVAGIDMYHKLHCLTSIRQEFTALVTDEQLWHTFWDEENEVQRLHWGHCFDFIRQDILCAADAALEPLDAELADKSGEGVVHQCRDYTVLEDMVKRWRVD